MPIRVTHLVQNGNFSMRKTAFSQTAGKQNKETTYEKNNFTRNSNRHYFVQSGF